MKDLKDFTLPMLLTSVFEWAYNNDLDLYKNLDYGFDSKKIRLAMTTGQGQIVRESDLFPDHNVFDLLVKAVLLADHQDLNKFQQTFLYHPHSTHKGLGCADWKYEGRKTNPYSSILLFITERSEQLEKAGLNNWHKSPDHEKHSHFRFWINHFLDSKDMLSLRFFILHSGNIRCYDTLLLGTNSEEDNSFNIVLKYLITENICPNPHYDKIEVPDFVNVDNYNKRYITSSGTFGGFSYLVYLTGDELRDLYKTKINKRKLNYMEKAAWAYINASSKDKETKFFFFIS